MNVALGHVCTFLNGGTPSTSVARYFEGSIPWITGADIVAPTVESARSFITEEAIQNSATNRVPAGTVLLVTRTSVGKVAVAGTALCFSQDITALIPNQQKLDTGYLVQFLHTKVPHFERLARGATIKGITREVVADLQVPIPPLPEQRRIAEILDRAEALKAKRRAVLAQLDTLTQSIFIDTFGDPAMNPKGWPVMALGDVVREKPNNGIFRKNPEYEQDDTKGIPVVWVEELFRGSSIDTKESRRVVPTKAEASKYGLHYGDVLFCRSSLKLDGIAFNNVYFGQDNAALFECHLIRVQPNMSIVSPIYLNCLLRLPQMRAIAKSKSKTATMTTIDQTALCSIPVMLPLFALQQEFARRVSALEKLKAAHRASLAEMDALFASLQHRAFRGKL